MQTEVQLMWVIINTIGTYILISFLFKCFPSSLLGNIINMALLVNANIGLEFGFFGSFFMRG